MRTHRDGVSACKRGGLRGKQTCCTLILCFRLQAETMCLLSKRRNGDPRYSGWSGLIRRLPSRCGRAGGTEARSRCGSDSAASY